MPRKFAVLLTGDEGFKIKCEIMDCLHVDKFKELVAGSLRGTESWDISLSHDGVKLTGKHRLGFYGIQPGSVIKVPSTVCWLSGVSSQWRLSEELE